MIRNHLPLFALVLLVIFSAWIGPVAAVLLAQPKPNIVWIIAEDMSPHFGCYGVSDIETPNIDQLAKEGIRFRNAVVTAPVCSAARSALITGMYQISIGAHHHRSGRGSVKIFLPNQVRLVPEIFREAGYHVLNLTLQDFMRTAHQVQENPRVRVAKTDYNFEWDQESTYQQTHWRTRRAGQPFFVQIQLRGGKLRGKGDGDKWPANAKRTLGSNTSPVAVTLPPYLPDDPTIRQDWAQYLDTVRYTDWEVGQIREALRDAGERETTYVFFITDHGISHVRNKQFCYEGGIHIPLIIHGPGLQPGTVRQDVVEHIDLAATSLGLAGLNIPAAMQSRDILADGYTPRRLAFSARDRCDETVDRIRSARTQRFKYIRNYYPHRPYLQPNRYKDAKPIIQAMRRCYKEGILNPAQALIMAETRPEEELYDLRNDPFELENLAADRRHHSTLQEMRDALADWIRKTGDRGDAPEAKAMYDSDMALYLNKNSESDRATLRRNIATMQEWSAQGK